MLVYIVTDEKTKSIVDVFLCRLEADIFAGDKYKVSEWEVK